MNSPGLRLSPKGKGTEALGETPPHLVGNRSRAFRRFRRNRAGQVGTAITVIFVLIALVGPFFAPYDYAAQALQNAMQLPSSAHWLGTDELGRDMLSRLITGARISLILAVSSVVGGLIIGTFIGVVGGYFGRWSDYLLMRLVDMLISMPPILLAIIVVAILGADLNTLIMAVAVYSIPSFGRLSRSSTLAVREMDYVLAAKALGERSPQIILRHILPNVTTPLIVEGTMRVATAILTASGLSFLGLGVQPPTPEWGAMLATGRSYIRESPQLSIFPGLCIVLVVLGVNLFGDALRDAWDPRQRD